MPTERTPENIPYVNLDSEPLKLGIDELNEQFALTLVNESFYQYENFRANYSDPRWNISDCLYYGWMPGKVWEGTAIPRSSLGMPIVFDQVESALPGICQEIFVPQDEWFQVETEPGSNVQEARQVQEHLSYVLEHSKNDYGLSARNEIELAIKSVLLYGNGGISVEYDSLLDRPVVQWVDIRDFYIDPGCPVPNVDEARSIIRRKFLTVDELIARRQDPRMKIPGNDVLYQMANSPLFAQGDNTKRNQEAIRGVAYTPNNSDYAVNPADRKIEVLLYYTKDRIIWVLNRQAVIYNEKNPYGFIPFCFAPCYIVPGRFYAQSVADVQESNQRFIEGLLNGRLDAVTFELQPPRVYKAGSLMTPAQLRWRPGATFGVDNPKDMDLLQPVTQLTNVFTEIGFIKAAAEERTGINGGSAPPPSNANRTATGVSAITGAQMSRLRQIVSNLENYLIVPMLYKLYEIVRLHNQADKNLNGISKDGNLTQVNSGSFKKKMRFRMLASSKMLSREKLAQIFPFLTQYMLNGTFLQGLQAQGSTIDFNEMFKMLQDATGTGRLYNFIRPMNEEEKKAISAPPPEAQMKAQQAQQELQVRQQADQLKSQTAVQVAQISAAPTPPDPAETQQKQTEMAMDMAREQQKMKSEAMLAQMNIVAKKQEADQKAAARQQEMALDRQQMQQDTQAQQLKHALDIKQAAQTNELQSQQLAASNQQTLQHTQESHDQNLENMKQKASENEKIRKKAATRPKAKGPSA